MEVNEDDGPPQLVDTATQIRSSDAVDTIKVPITIVTGEVFL